MRKEALCRGRVSIKASSESVAQSDYLSSVNLTKLSSFADRIVDELNPEANFTKQEIMKLICEKV